MLRHEGGFAEETLVRNTDEKLRFGDPDKNRADLYYSWFRLRDLRAGEEETPHGTLYNHPTDRCALKKKNTLHKVSGGSSEELVFGSLVGLGDTGNTCVCLFAGLDSN